MVNTLLAIAATVARRAVGILELLGTCAIVASVALLAGWEWAFIPFGIFCLLKAAEIERATE